MTMKNAFYTGIFTLALIGLVPLANAADTSVKNETATGVSTDVGTVQNSGVTIGDKTKIRGDVYTGSNTASTDVDTDVSTRTSTDTTNADGDIKSESTTVGTVKGKGEVNTSKSNSSIKARSEQQANWDRGKKYGHDKQDNWENRNR